MRTISIINPANIQHFTSTKRTTYRCGKEEPFVLPRYDRDLSYYTPGIGMVDAKILTSNSTDFFRPDLPWSKIGKIFDKHFKEGKVNIHNFACSDGSETFSLVIALLEQLGEKKAQRFFPIKASDIDCEVIRLAKSGKIQASDYDISAIKAQIKDGNIKKYFDVTSLGYNSNILTPKEILTKNVVFETKPMIQGLSEVEDGNNIILARNFWKYLSEDDLAQTSWNLSKKANDKTLVLIGKFDWQKTGNIPLHLLELGFNSYSDLKQEENILCRKDYSTAPIYKNNYPLWRKRIKYIYNSYLPSYMR